MLEMKVKKEKVQGGWFQCTLTVGGIKLSYSEIKLGTIHIFEILVHMSSLPQVLVI